mgnify:CR=1 FL=1
MPYRVTTYEDAFVGVLGIKIDDRIKKLIKELEVEGHTEKSIAFSIWKSQEKLLTFKGDSRFLSVLRNEVNKWSWKKDDPRWQEYWRRKKEEEKAKKIRQQLEYIREDEREFKSIEERANGKKRIKKATGYVYFIQGLCGGAIKIGFSKNPEVRLKELQTGYPDTLTILLMIPGTEATERAIHRKFEASRLKGEWFRPDDYLIEEMKKLKKMYSQ